MLHVYQTLVYQHFVESVAAYIASLRSEDYPIGLHLERYRQFLAAPPPEEWNGVYVAPSK
jgi:hypothetical protein